MPQTMTQEQRLDFLLRWLLHEKEEYREMEIPADQRAKQRLLRSLLNLRPPVPASEEFLRVQDAYLQARLQERGVTKWEDLTPVQPGLYLWQGDITTLAVDAIVNAANSALLGCFVPCHGCIDNAIHTYAGVQLRLACAEQMRRQGHEEPTGQAKITKGYNLPAKYVIHTPGPVWRGGGHGEEALLASCYRESLKLAAEHGGPVETVTFVCFSQPVKDAFDRALGE